MTTNTDAAALAIRRAWSIDISEAEVDNAARVTEGQTLLEQERPRTTEEPEKLLAREIEASGRNVAALTRREETIR